jgi:hypothetical protein
LTASWFIAGKKSAQKSPHRRADPFSSPRPQGLRPAISAMNQRHHITGVLLRLLGGFFLFRRQHRRLFDFLVALRSFAHDPAPDGQRRMPVQIQYRPIRRHKPAAQKYRKQLI